jgi:hypothetical protein
MCGRGLSRRVVLELELEEGEVLARQAARQEEMADPHGVESD